MGWLAITKISFIKCNENKGQGLTKRLTEIHENKRLSDFKNSSYKKYSGVKTYDKVIFNNLWRTYTRWSTAS